MHSYPLPVPPAGITASNPSSSLRPVTPSLPRKIASSLPAFATLRPLQPLRPLRPLRQAQGPCQGPAQLPAQGPAQLPAQGPCQGPASACKASQSRPISPSLNRKVAQSPLKTPPYKTNIYFLLHCNIFLLNYMRFIAIE